MDLHNLEADLLHLKNLPKAQTLSRFFKTGKGQYGEGDQFLGLTVPQQRQIAKSYTHLPLSSLQKLLKSSYHEFRLTALLILVAQFHKATSQVRSKIFQLYLKNTKFINNWDLVDLSAPQIVGQYLLDKDRRLLHRLAHSTSLWEKRIAILATYTFIKKGQYHDTLKIARLLLRDPHDLIHKSLGWMLREVGKKDFNTLKNFLDQHAFRMPRTMLRYAIEKLPSSKRQFYLKQPK